MSTPDFEIGTSLRARRLRAHDPPDAATEGEAVVLDREETRSGLPARLEAGGRYEEIAVGKKVSGRIPNS
ncbi:MAG TPA: hypothetical protein VE596_04540 [Gaiellaceae bacterium]|jgi:hypothetical protein|nr:hypothetical protein [Gaiellaceae bacterium]